MEKVNHRVVDNVEAMEKVNHRIVDNVAATGRLYVKRFLGPPVRPYAFT